MTPERPLSDKDFRYSSRFRGASIWWQVSSLVELRAKFGCQSVLEVGSGRGVTASLLKDLGFTYFDVLNLPSQIASPSPKLQSTSESSVADVVCAFQVLEHNPLVQLPRLFETLARLSNRFVVVSLPSSRPYLALNFEFKIFSGYQAVRRPQLFIRIPLPRMVFPRARGRLGTSVLVHHERLVVEEIPNPNHFWEVGERGASVSRIVKLASESGLVLREKWSPFSNLQQIFFVFEKVDRQPDSDLQKDPVTSRR